MARKKITNLIGGDPEYSKQFGSHPKPVQSPPKPQLTPTQTEQQKIAKKPKSKPTITTALDASATPSKSKAGKPSAVHVRAVPKKKHEAGLNALSNVGLPAADVVRLAGKRAMNKFVLSPDYVPAEEVERLKSNLSFRTMKTLDAAMLDKLRDQGDPLRLRSDAAVIQGQLEPVFWTELDSVIKELGQKYNV